MGFVSLMSMLKTGVSASVGVTGTKPDLVPGRVGVERLAASATQGVVNEDSVIVWFCGGGVSGVGRGWRGYCTFGWNWNCTMVPAAAWMLLGK